MNYTKVSERSKWDVNITRKSFKWIFNRINRKKGNQYPVTLKKCRDVHIGTKIEIHSEQPQTSYLKEEDEEKNEKYVNCSQKLKNKYKTYFAYMRSFLWEGKRNDFPLKDYFVDLTIQKADLFGKERGDKVNLNEIFSNQDDEHQTILVTGDPGYGKTTLCRKIAYDWASTDYLQRFDLTVCIILRELGDRSVNEALIDNLHENSSIDKDWKLPFTQLNILVILDGFDEVVEKNKIIKFIREESFDISRRMTIVVTSRPQATEEIREDMKMRFSIEGFSPEHQKKCIQLMYRDESKAIRLVEKVEEDEFYKEIAECPLMLHMLCCLFNNTEMEEIRSITDLYIRMFTLITERYVRKTDQNGKFERGKHFIGENLLLRLGTLDLKLNSVTSEALIKSFPNEDEYNFIIGLDILAVNSFSQYDKIIRYHFLHSTFREFLVAFTAYNDFSYFSTSITDNVLLFLLGLFGSDKFSKRFLRNLKERVFTPNFMLRAHKEIKLKENWEEFCSNSKVKFYDIELNEMKQLLNLYAFKQLFFCFSETEFDYENNKNEILQFFNDFSFPNGLKFYLFLINLTTDWDYSHDIRESVSCIIDFFRNVRPIDYEIYFIGIYNFIDVFHCFRNVNYSLNLTGDILEELSIGEDEELIALQTLNSERTFNSYFLSLEQYKTLRDRMKIYPIRVKKSKCVII
ncbi:NLR family CARD domain-containing protein 4-like isoform X2 [Centruroides vittatus]|uniref:NLR family CARD domain-containing protein 4-like isoform X2 n=1 Tax=Centruroides vittatus TaxID=120091 RepID=UPI0035105CFE